MMRKMPPNRQSRRVQEIRSARPVKPIPVVVIRTTGPTSASMLFMYSAFSKSLNLYISEAAASSTLPDMSRINMIARRAFSNNMTTLGIILTSAYADMYFDINKRLSK